MNPTLTAALEMASRGFYVFPVKPDKTPYTEKGCNSASDRHSMIKTWWRVWPTAGVGVATGPSNLVVVDIDNKNGKDGDASWLDLCRTYGYSGATVEAWTINGGRHLYFTGESFNSIGKLGDGIDVRGHGGYVVAPPTTGYEWGELSALDAEPAEAPEWLLALNQEAFSGDAPVEGDERDEIFDGEKHDFLLRTAGCLRRQGFSERAIYSALVAALGELSRTPSNENRVAQVARSVCRYKCGSTDHVQTVRFNPAELMRKGR